MKKSQVALEFLLVMGVLLTIFIIFKIFLLKETVDISHEKEYTTIKDIALMIQTELNMAQSLEDGFTRTFTLPKTVDGINYTTNITNDYIVITSRNHEYVLSIPQIIGTIEKGDNLINKTDGIIYVTQ